MTKTTVVSALQFSAVFLCVACSSALASDGAATWTPYVAQYRQTITIHDPSGHVTRSERVQQETRSTDGSILTTQLNAGKPVRGKLWQSDGKIFSLDYIQKKAIQSSGQFPRHHTPPQTDAPLGSETILGLQCTVYPVHSKKNDTGTGRVCVDVSNDIRLESELHVGAGKTMTDVTDELISIDLHPTGASSPQHIPEGFEVLTPATQKCSNCSHGAGR